MGHAFSFGGLVYRDAVPLDAKTHGGKAVTADAWIRLVQDISTCPLTVDELARASRDFPIVFASGPNAAPIALLALSARPNPFVTDGGWAPAAHVPKAIERYPILLSKPATGGERTVMVDEAALTSARRAPDFRLYRQDGTRSAFLNNKIAAARAYQAGMATTRVFMEVLEACALLHDRHLVLGQADGGGSEAIGPVHVIDPERLAGLPDAVVVELHKAGFLGAIHAHLISLGPHRLEAR